MIYRKLTELKPHPKNDYYFDDTDEGSFEILKESLRNAREQRLDNEIIITEDNIIICGHQRVRACRDLGWEKVNCKVEKGLTEEEIEIKLIMDNLSQRTAKGLNPLKLGRCIDKLSEYFGLENGNNQYTQNRRVGNNFRGSIGKITTKRDLAQALGITERTVNNYQSLATNSIEELQDAILSGKIKPTKATDISRLSHEEQQEVLAQIGAVEKVTGAVVDEAIKTVKELQKSQGEAVPVAKAESTSLIDERQKSKEITLTDFEDYIKSGKGTDEDEIALTNLKLLDNNMIESFAEFAHKYVDSIKYNLEDLYDLLRSGNSTKEMLEELRENNLDGALAFLNVFILKDIETISDSLQHIIETVENMKD